MSALSPTLIQPNATSTQQKAQLPNPLDLSDYEILNNAYLTHVKDDQECDTTTLYDLVSNVLSASTPISGPTVVNPSQSQITTVTSFKPEFRELKLISCQMTTTRGTAQCAHQTTLCILQRLRCFSWDAKALITLAAFSLEYGEFWRLLRIPASDLLGNSLKQLNQVQSRNVRDDIIDLVTFIVQVLPLIRKWAMWYADDYDTEKVYSLSLATQDIPVVVYWTVAATVACTGNLLGSISDYKLSEFKQKLSIIVDKLKKNLESCANQIGKIADVEKRIKDSEKVKDVVGLLKLLIHGNGPQIPQIYEGSTQIKSGVEVFKEKYVLLFISSLKSDRDEILLLNSIYKRLEENPKIVVKGFKKEDFKILWIPVVNVWDDNRKNDFKELRKEIKWYVLEYFSELPGIRIIQEKLKYDIEKKEPIVSVINPQGGIINENAKPIIFQWGIEAFPFRKEDGEDLTKKWQWLWKLIEKVDPNIIAEEVGRDHYFFIYGGNDNKWIQDFSTAIEQIKKNENIKDVDLTIHRHQLGKDNPDKVPYFWIGIDGKKPKKKCQGDVDCEIQKVVESLLCLKKDPFGWVVLSKGHHIKLLGHGEPMLQTVQDFDKWKENVLEKESFDVAFKEYYDSVLKAISARCDNYTSDVLATITCPNPSCGRVMEVTSVNYSCCHHDNPDSCCI